MDGWDGGHAGQCFRLAARAPWAMPRGGFGASKGGVCLASRSQKYPRTACNYGVRRDSE